MMISTTATTADATAAATTTTAATSTTSLLLLPLVPVGSPFRGGDVTVYVLDINQPSLPTLFIVFLCLFLSLCPFQLHSIS